MARSPVEGFHEEVDRAATGEADGEGLVVGVAERDDTPLTLTREHLERGGDHRALDAAAGDRAGDLAVVAHRHGRAGITRRRALQRDDARHRHAVAAGAPALDVVQDLFHALTFSPETMRASCSNDARLWPSTNSSTCGRAAAIPRARGAKLGEDFNGFTHTTWCATRCRRSICAPSSSGSPRSHPSDRITTTAPRAMPRTPHSSLNRRSPSPSRVPPDQSVTLLAAAAMAASGSRLESSRVIRVSRVPIANASTPPRPPTAPCRKPTSPPADAPQGPLPSPSSTIPRR